MKNWKLLLVIPLIFMGCMHDLIEPENPLQERILTKSSLDSENVRILSFSTWTRTGTSFRTMQIHLSHALAGPLTVYFDLHPISKGLKLPAIAISSCCLPAGQTYTEVDIPLDAAVWREMEYNSAKDDWEYVDKVTSTFSIQIKNVNYDGDTDPLYIDQSVWKLKRTLDIETYGWDINRISGEGQKNYRPPYDVIGKTTEPDPNPGGGGGGTGPKDPPSLPIE